MSWDFDTTQRPAARGTRSNPRDVAPLASTTTRHDFDERREGDLLARCIESHKEKKNSDLLRLAIDRVDPKLIASLESDMKTQVASISGGTLRSTSSEGHPSGFSEPTDASVFHDAVSLEFKSGNITGKRQDKLVRTSTLTLA
jgi:hypothetical protein